MPFFGVPIRNGLPIGLGSVAGFGVQQFDPSQLFAGGTVAGAWYDPSDLSTMFDTSAGTTPVAMPGQGAPVPVGLMLDKSQGLVLGSDVVTNGNFATDSNWNKGTGWAISGGAAVATATSDPIFQGPSTGTGVGTTVGKFYVATWDQVVTSGSTRFRSNTYSGNYASSGRQVYYFTADSQNIHIYGNSFTGTIDNLVVRELPGNHAIAFNNTTARPELRARVNLLTYSEEFDQGVWQKNDGSSVTANVVVAPDGTTTADQIDLSASQLSRVQQSIPATTAIYTFTVWLRVPSGSASIRFGDGTDLDVITVTTTWQRFTATKTVTAPTQPNFTIRNESGGGAKTLYAWGADLRPANIGANVPAYQRIADALTYDTSGFPLYLRFDGIDDSMYTPANLNLSGTNKVAVFAGVRKLANTPDGVIAELSAAVSANNGAFGLYAPSASGAATLRFASKGTISSATDGPAGFTAPATAVVNAFGDISGDLANLRFDGSQSSSSTTDQGTGNYGTHPLYIGARNNSSLWLNGQLYSLIIAGSAVSAGNISATEQWVAQRTGLALP